MLSSILFSANIVLPSFILILIGRLIVLKNWVTTQEMDKVSRLTFYLIATKIFTDVAGKDPETFSNYPMVIYCCVVTIVTFFLIWFIAAHALKKKESVGSFVQNCFRGSFSIFGMSMVDSFAGSEGVAKCALLLAMIITVVNILVSLVLTPLDADSSIAKHLLKMGKSIVTNPLLIASVLGLAVSYARIQIPYLISATLNHLGAMSVPLALMSIGSGMTMKRVKSNIKYATIAAFIKTFILPLSAALLAISLGFRDFELTVIVIIFAAANPAANYVMSLATGNDSDLAASGIVLSTIFSVFSSMLFISALRSLGFI